MSTMLLQPDAIVGTFRNLIDQEITCERRGEMLLLETPYAVGNGYSLRAYLSLSPEGIIVSDGGFASAQVEQFIHTRATLRHRYRELGEIAERLGLLWDGDFSYTDSTIEDAVRRLKLLATAVQESNGLLATRQGRQERSAILKISEGVEQRGARVQRRAPIKVLGRERPVVVDLKIETSLRNAAVEVIGAQTGSGVERQVDRAVAHLHALANGQFGGLLFGVYEEHGLAAERQFIEQFNSAKPRQALLLSEDEAVDRISELLAA